jgi:multiple sugar transport system substrate-binding protein
VRSLRAGSGLPDVVQIEFQHLESFRQLDAFADIGQWANPHKAEFPEGTWNQLGKGDVVNAMPQDTGPMAMLYRKDIFDKQAITPPATWAEFADAAEKIHAADPNVFIPTRSSQATGSMVFCGKWAGSRSAAMATSS